MKKLKSMLKLDNTVEIPEHLKESIKYYNLGTERSLEDFYNFGGINIQNKTVSKDFCKSETKTKQTKQTNIFLFSLSISLSILVLVLVLVIMV